MASAASAAVGRAPIQANNENEEYKHQFLNMIADFQESRMNDQRAALPNLPGLHANENVIGQILQANSAAAAAQAAGGGEGGQGSNAANMPDDSFFDMLMRCQGARLEEQRSSIPDLQLQLHEQAPTMPDEDFFSLIQRVQSGRIDTQRSDLPDKQGVSNSASSAGASTASKHSKSDDKKRSSWKGSKKKHKEDKK